MQHLTGAALRVDKEVTVTKKKFLKPKLPEKTASC